MEITETAKQIIRELYKNLYNGSDFQGTVEYVVGNFKTEKEAQKKFDELSCLIPIHVSQTNKVGAYIAYEWDSSVFTCILRNDCRVSVDIYCKALNFMFATVSPDFLDENDMWNCLYDMSDEQDVMVDE